MRFFLLGNVEIKVALKEKKNGNDTHFPCKKPNKSFLSKAFFIRGNCASH